MEVKARENMWATGVQKELKYVEVPKNFMELSDAEWQQVLDTQKQFDIENRAVIDKWRRAWAECLLVADSI